MAEKKSMGSKAGKNGTHKKEHLSAARCRVRKDRFLEHFAKHGCITFAAEAAGVSKGRHYEWRKNDPEYAEQFAVAKELALESLEMEARRRAVEGSKRDKFHQGSTRRRASHTLTWNTRTRC